MGCVLGVQFDTHPHTQFNPNIRLKLFHIDHPKLNPNLWDACEAGAQVTGDKWSMQEVTYGYCVVLVLSMGNRGWHVTPGRWPCASWCNPLKYDLAKFDHTQCHRHLWHVSPMYLFYRRKFFFFKTVKLEWKKSSPKVLREYWHWFNFLGWIIDMARILCTFPKAKWFWKRKS